jgi:hypothetical protein
MPRADPEADVDRAKRNQDLRSQALGRAVELLQHLDAGQRVRFLDGMGHCRVRFHFMIR